MQWLHDSEQARVRKEVAIAQFKVLFKNLSQGFKEIMETSFRIVDVLSGIHAGTSWI
jgi:hypothetical protein